MIKKIAFTLFIFLSIMIGASAQSDTTVILPGSKLIDGTVIKPYTNKWKLNIITAEGKVVPNGMWTDYGQIIELEKKQYFHRVQDLYGPKGELTDTWTNMVELETLIPIRFSTINPKGGFSNYNFKQNIIEGSRNLNAEDNEISEIKLDLSENVFDWNLYGMLLVGLPLKPDFLAKLPFYDTANGAVKWLSVHVKEQEVVKLPNKKEIICWKIETNQRLVFWISENAPYVIKLELQLPNNAKIVWEAF